MKKLIALLLALCMLTFVTFAAAEPVKLTENASGFDLTMELPDNATVRVETFDDVPYTFISFADATLPKIYLSVAATEEYDLSSIADLSKDDLEALFTTVSADMDDPSYEMRKTDNGYDYMLVNDNSETDSAMLLLLYQGYFIQMTVWNDQYAVLGDDDITAAELLINTLNIVPVA